VRLYAQSVSRLLVDCNRSEDNPNLFSPFSPLTNHERERLLVDHYRPYREAVRAEVERMLTIHVRVVHLSVHSFTPELRGEVRSTDIGLLFDPKSAFETGVCDRWRDVLLSTKTDFAVHENRPYRGDADGLTTTLRNTLPRDRYAGIELEVNQKYPRKHPQRWAAMQTLVTTTFATAIRQLAA
jgi:predicted N-formylglutamate amidohydrolase